MQVSLIATVKNEASNIAALLESMLTQTRMPDEIVINDNGSQDETAAIIRRYIDAGHPIRLVHGGHNIPSGRNNAIRHANAPLIASCDAGLTLPPDWLQSIVAPLERGEADVAAGFYIADPQSLWEFALGATNYPDVEEVDPGRFLPAGQSVAFIKAAWEAVGGYPEWADTCEDLIFDLELKRRGYLFAFVPDAAVRFRPRETVRAYLRQYYSYARGDGVAKLWPKRHAARYGFYTGLLLIAALARRYPLAWLLALPPIALHSQKPMRRTWRRGDSMPLHRRVAAVLMVPFIRLLGDAAKMVGYPVGVWLLVSGKAQPKATGAEPNWVVRAGITTPQQLQAGVAEHYAVPGLHGFSVQSEPGRSISDLAQAGQFPNAQISYSTVEALVAAGQAVGYAVHVVRSPGKGFHHTVEVPDPFPDVLADALSRAFKQMSNPARLRP